MQSSIVERHFAKLRQSVVSNCIDRRSVVMSFIHLPDPHRAVAHRCWRYIQNARHSITA